MSDTRTLEADTGGALVAELLEEAGHVVTDRRVVADDVGAIREAVAAVLGADACRAVLLTGGTGVAPRDVTPEAVAPLLDRELPGFGELFRMLSYEEIGSAALLSRALAGLRGAKALFALPGSRNAIRLAMTKLVLPELGHIVGEGARAAHQGAAAEGR